MKKFTALFISFILTASVLFSAYASAARITDIDQDSGSLTLIKYQTDVTKGDNNLPVDDPEKRVSGAEFKAYQIIKISKETSGERKYEVAKNFTKDNGVDNAGYEGALTTLASLVSRDAGASFTSTPELLKLIPALRNVAAKLDDAADSAENGMIYTSTEIKKPVDPVPEPGSGETTETGTGEYTFGAGGKIELGVYLVVETKVPEGYSQVSMPFLVSVPQWTESTDAEGNVTGNWDYNITAYPKDDPISVDKNIVLEDGKTEKTTDANIGDTIKYSITTNIPTYVPHDNTSELTEAQQKNIKYIFTDNMSKGLDFKDDFKAEIIQGDDVVATLASDTDYTLTTNKNTETDGTTITADFKWDSLDAHQGEKISISYTAQLNSNAVIGGEGNPNTALVTYTNDPTLIGSKPQNTPESTTKVFVRTIGMELIKTLNGETPKVDSGIADVVFGMTKMVDTAESDVWFVKSDDNLSYSVYNGELSGEPDGNGDYTVQIDGENRTVTKKLSPIASGDSIGKIIVDGLAEGKYYLSEEKTAAGYNLLSEKVLIDIKFGNSVTVTKEGGGELVSGPEVSEDNTKFTITVDNPKQPPLPLAGAQGVISIILGGALLAIGAAILYYFFFKRRKNDNKAQAHGA